VRHLPAFNSIELEPRPPASILWHLRDPVCKTRRLFAEAKAGGEALITLSGDF
jgi:hypothetical protein